MSNKAENTNKIVKKYTKPFLSSNTSLSLLNCSKIVCYNQSAAITRWALETNSTEIYLSETCGINESCILDLNTLNLTAGTQFVLKAIVVDKECTSTVILSYYPESNITTNFRVERTELNPLLIFLGTTLNKYKK